MPMTPRDRKAELVRAGVSQASIAAATGYSQAHVSDVLRGSRRNESIELAIATAIGCDVDAVFAPREQTTAA